MAFSDRKRDVEDTFWHLLQCFELNYLGENLKPGLDKFQLNCRCRPHMPRLVKHDDSNTSQGSFQVFGLGQCYTPGITHFTSVDTFIQQTFLLLNVHFSGVNYSRFTHVLFYAGIALTWTSRFSPQYVKIGAYINWRAWWEFFSQ